MSLEEYEDEFREQYNDLLTLYQKYSPVLPCIKIWKFDDVNEELLAESPGRDADVKQMHEHIENLRNGMLVFERVLTIPDPSEYSKVRGMLSNDVASVKKLLPKAVFLIAHMIYSDIFYNSEKVEDVPATVAKIDALVAKLSFQKAALYPSILKQIEASKASVAKAPSAEAKAKQQLITATTANDDNYDQR